MKKKLIIILILIVATTIVIFITHNGREKFEVPAFENIKSVKIEPPTSGPIRPGEYEDMYFDLSKREDIDMVNNILGWLKSGRIIGNAKDEAVSNGSTPTYLIIELKDGTEISIKSAVSTTYINNGTEVKSQSINGQITISVTRQKNIRVLSPELKSFIDNGWEVFFSYSK